MSEPFKLSCSCGKHDFVFAAEPWQVTEVKCPECGQVVAYDPKTKATKKAK
jgi:ribosomal protein S27E